MEEGSLDVGALVGDFTSSIGAEFAGAAPEVLTLVGVMTALGIVISFARRNIRGAAK